ncbi:hypothetical protein RDWZM_003606 [Blomia tropicalis]|uniref:Uncharacterized protein n=1 Tax=Blomia tropicalis TaxID=40697 RepID=A0A9Q0MFP7_BLOTA|nr:hypothetical protein RDWZM_003606 [Blomia tropicalis]
MKYGNGNNNNNNNNTNTKITVNVRVADSRVLSFPAVTICNLNLVHRGRFCASKEIDKPEIIENILCANIGDLLNTCEISNMMNELLEKGQETCGVKDTGQASTQSGTTNTTNRRRGPTRGKRQLQLRDIIKTAREVSNAFRGDGQKGSSIIDIYNDFQENLKQLAEGSGGPLDESLTQFANFLGFNVTNSLDIIPALFMKAFTDTTGCRLGSSDMTSVLPDNVRSTLKSLTRTFMNNQFIEFCTTPWIESLKTSIKKGETPWFFLLDQLSSWLADLAKNRPIQARAIGHSGTDLIQQCTFAGRTCSSKVDFSHFFYNSYGNCYTYNLQINNTERSEDSLSGFTGPKFGLELILNLETDQYMPTSRESGAKIIVHDTGTRADPDQESVHVAPGLVTYIGVKMVNITRLAKPYPDKCSNKWSDLQLELWARTLHYDAYSTQICLKLCLQRLTIAYCNCWLPSSPPPKEDVPQCNNRKNKNDEICSESIRQMYYNETINCDCPPRCTELSFEKFVSTGQELQQCSILTATGSSFGNSQSDDAIEKKVEEPPKKEEEEETNSEYKIDKENIAKVVVYFQSLSYQEITQYPKYTLTTLLGGIGGILGVYLGFSFLALIELFDVFGRTICCNSSDANRQSSRTSSLEHLANEVLHEGRKRSSITTFESRNSIKPRGRKGKSKMVIMVSRKSCSILLD